MRTGRPPKQNPFVCPKHGEMPEENFMLQASTKRNGVWRCKLCKRQQGRDHYERTRKKYLPPKGSTEYFQLLADARERKVKYRRDLTDGIVRDHLRRQIGIEKQDASKEIIETFRAVLKIKRRGRKSREQPV